MNKFIITLTIFIVVSACSIAKSQYTETLGRIENSLFGIQYANQTDIQRLNRIEENVYGKVSKENMKLRIEKLTQDVSADAMGKEIKPKQDTFADEEDPYYQEKPLKADNSVHYPVIDKMEQQIFNKTFENTELEARLDNLEKKTFKQTYKNDDLNSRTDRLKAALIKEDNFYAKEDYPTDSNYSADSDYQGDSDFYGYNQPQTFSYKNNMPSYKPPMSFGNNDEERTLSQLEKKILRTTYKNDSIQRRLSRLETSLFNTSFSEDDNQTRLERLGSVYAAQKSSKKYDSFSKHMSTAVQIGTILLMVALMVL